MKIIIIIIIIIIIKQYNFNNNNNNNNNLKIAKSNNLQWKLFVSTSQGHRNDNLKLQIFTN